MNAFRQRSGFTLVELLVVVVIIGVMALMIAPSVSAGSDAARVRVAVRGAIQVSKYARTMALLRQVPVDLVMSSDGRLSVTAAEGAGESIVSAQSFSITNAAAVAEGAAAEPAEASEPAGGAGGGGSGYTMADLALEKTYERVSFEFEGYTDSVEQGRGGRSAARAQEEEHEEEGASGESKSFRVRYKSNGTCRPYRMRVVAAGDELCSTVISIDLLGSARVEDDE